MMTEERIAKLTSAVYKVTDLFPEKEPLKFVVRRESLDVLFSYVVLISKPTLGQREKSIKKAIASSKSLVHYFDLAELQNWADARNFSILKTEYSNLIFWFEEQAFSLENDAKKALSSIEAFQLENDEVDYDVQPRVEVKAIRSSLIEKEAETFNHPAEINHNASVKVEPNLVKVAREMKAKKAEVKNMEENGEKRKEAIEIKSDVVIDYEELSSIQLKTLEILQNKGFLKASQISKYFEDASERSVRREIKELKDKRIVVAKGGGKSTFYEINHVY
jgi:DNA-binding transcriptional ArsR family regulator